MASTKEYLDFVLEQLSESKYFGDPDDETIAQVRCPPLEILVSITT